jgi:hypothetical protein
MKKIIIIVFILTLALTLFFGAKHLNKPNDIDYLESIATKALKLTSNHNELYYFSNSKERGLLFKTQFVFIPKQILKKNIDEISESEIVLVLIDKNSEPSTLLSNVNFTNSDTLFSDENKYYKLILLKK